MVFLLPDDELIFPDPFLGDEDGLIAIGGDLSSDRLILAYSNGIFPWFSFRDTDMPYWYCPLNRFVIFPEEIHISHSMRQLLRQQRFSFSFNKDFEGVIRGCAEIDSRIEKEGAWLGENMIAAYLELHRRKRAASVEVWEDEKLAGGLYGVTAGNIFCGESMFSRVSGASKLALIVLAQRLQGRGMIIDCQFETPHLLSMGGRHISYTQYLRYLKNPSDSTPSQ